MFFVHLNVYSAPFCLCSDLTQVSCVTGRFFTIWATREAHILYIHRKFIWSSVLFKASVSLLIFFLGDLSIDVNGVLTVPYHYCNPVGLIYSGTPVLGFPGGTSGKEASCQCSRHWRRTFTPWVGKIPWRRAWQPTPVFLPGESHEQRRLVGYSA